MRSFVREAYPFVSVRVSSSSSRFGSTAAPPGGLYGGRDLWGSRTSRAMLVCRLLHRSEFIKQQTTQTATKHPRSDNSGHTVVVKIKLHNFRKTTCLPPRVIRPNTELMDRSRHQSCSLGDNDTMSLDFLCYLFLSKLQKETFS